MTTTPHRTVAAPSLPTLGIRGGITPARMLAASLVAPTAAIAAAVAATAAARAAHHRRSSD